VTTLIYGYTYPNLGYTTSVYFQEIAIQRSKLFTAKEASDVKIINNLRINMNMANGDTWPYLRLAMVQNSPQL
jgi:hypothetical protein